MFHRLSPNPHWAIVILRANYTCITTCHYSHSTISMMTASRTIRERAYFRALFALKKKAARPSIKSPAATVRNIPQLRGKKFAIVRQTKNHPTTSHIEFLSIFITPPVTLTPWLQQGNQQYVARISGTDQSLTPGGTMPQFAIQPQGANDLPLREFLYLLRICHQPVAATLK